MDARRFRGGLRVAWLAFVVAAAAGPALATTEACRRECERCPEASPDAEALACLARAVACRADEVLCETKLALYRAHMEELARGAELHGLPELYRAVLAPFFPGVDLARVRFGFSDHQPPENATTDCLDIFFARRDFVARLRDGALSADDEIQWLLHELRHAEQCMALGGRDAYAVRWLGELGVSVIRDSDLGTLHARIPMEGDAIVRSEWVAQELALCCREPSGRLARPGDGERSVEASGAAPLAAADRRAAPPQAAPPSQQAPRAQ